MNAQRRELDGHRLSKPLKCELGGAVDAPAWEGGIAGDRRDVDHVAAAGTAHVRQDRTRHVQQAEDVRGELLLDLLAAGLLDPAERSEEHTSELQSLAYLVC